MTDPLPVFTEHVPTRSTASAATRDALPLLVLPFEQRQKARQRVRLVSGAEIGIHLPRGTVLRGGDLLRCENGGMVRVVAAREPVSTVWSRDLRQLAQVAYHLGNRHVALEIGAGWVRYLEDYVLDDMVRQLGLTVIHEREPFEPEAGAYGAHSHAHAPAAQQQRPLAHERAHEHAHGHTHEHVGEHRHLTHDEHRTIFGGPWRHGHDQ